MKFVFALFVKLSVMNTCLAQGLPPEVQLPNWAVQQLAGLGKNQSIEINVRTNPFVWRGDFDGDGRFDLAVMIRDAKSKKEGVAFLFRGERKPIIVGAGTEFGNGGDDFSWLELWSVADRGTLQHSYYEKAVRLKADGLIVAREGSASALIYIRGSKAVWQQQGD